MIRIRKEPSRDRLSGLIGVLSPMILGRLQVRGHSMEPAMRAGDRVLVSRLALAVRGPRKGEVVAVHHPVKPDTILLKRLVGVPGEMIPVKTRDRLDADVDAPTQGGELLRTLGPDEYLVLGDRRDDSEDSRHFGPVSRDHIMGKVWLRYWPADAVGPIHSRGR